MKPTYEQLEQQLAAVVAENAGLKSKAAELVHEASEVYSAYNATITEPDGDFMDMQTLQEMQCVETPATDAYLAGVRAQAKADGVQEYANSFRHSASKIREGHGNTIRVRALLHEAKNADEFAAQLRQGAEHE